MSDTPKTNDRPLEDSQAPAPEPVPEPTAAPAQPGDAAKAPEPPAAPNAAKDEGPRGPRLPYAPKAPRGADPSAYEVDPKTGKPAMPKPPQRISVISAILLLLVAFFVGSQMINMMNAKETDALITSEFVQAVEQDRVVDVVYDAGEYTVTGTYYPAATAGSTAGDAYNSAFEALDAKAESVIGTDAPQVSTTEIDEQTIGAERKYTSTYVGQDSLMQLLSDHPGIQYQVKLPDSFFQALLSLLPMLLLAGLMIFFFVQMNKANNSQMSFGKAKAKKTAEELSLIHI